MHDIKPGQSIDLLKELHILTRDGKMNQDSRRKLKQVYHLYQFIEPLLLEIQRDQPDIQLVDHGAGKSYLGFILYDLFFKTLNNASRIYGIETRDELVKKSEELAKKLNFPGMKFLNLSVAESIDSDRLPERIDMVTALHACNTATDDAIRFALKKQAKFMVLVPCCQAEVASVLKKNKGKSLAREALAEIWRHPLHTREFGSQVTNVLRCLQLEAHGYQVNVTELVGWEHSMKNELIIATYKNLPRRHPVERLNEVLETLGLEEMRERFFTPPQCRRRPLSGSVAAAHENRKRLGGDENFVQKENEAADQRQHAADKKQCDGSGDSGIENVVDKHRDDYCADQQCAADAQGDRAMDQIHSLIQKIEFGPAFLQRCRIGVSRTAFEDAAAVDDPRQAIGQHAQLRTHSRQ